jgi:hypothetical protein
MSPPVITISVGALPTMHPNKQDLVKFYDGFLADLESESEDD